MPDQAAGLRSLFARRRPSLLIVAGCDASKAAVALHFAREAAAGGRTTVLIDGTAGQLATACDLACRYELAHVLAGDKTLADVVRTLTPQLLLLPAARALSLFGSYDDTEEARLAEAFSSGIVQALSGAGAQETQVDLIVVNADELQADRAVEAFGGDARVVLVASDHAASLRGAYLELKALSQVSGLRQFEVVVPRGDAAEPLSRAYGNLATAARRFLEIELTEGCAVTLPPTQQSGPGSRRSTALRGFDAVHDAFHDAANAFANATAIEADPDAYAMHPSISSSTEEVFHAAAIA